MRYKKSTKVLLLFEDLRIVCHLGNRVISSNFTLKVSIDTIEQRADGSMNCIFQKHHQKIRKMEWGFAI